MTSKDYVPMFFGVITALGLIAGMVSYTMAHYDPDWKALVEWKAKLAKEETQAAQNITVLFEKAPESNLVPEK